MQVPAMMLLLLAALLDHASACSYVEVPVPEPGSHNATRYIIGRTNEFGSVLGAISYAIQLHPRDGSAQFAYVSVDVKVVHISVPFISIEGMNEAGFTASALMLHESVYQEKSKEGGGNVGTTEVVSSLLKSAGTVDEALAWFDTHTVFKQIPSEGVEFHWAIADASGRSLVVEYLEGRRKVYENTPRVMTNDPNLDYQWRHLNSYVNLNPGWPRGNDGLAVHSGVGEVPRAIGHGFNLFGMPGDSSPPSRFVQLFYLRGYALHHKAPKSVNSAIVLTSGLLNRVFIPKGTVARKDRVEGFEYTPFAVIKIPSEGRLLFRGYANLQWREINFAKLDLTQEASWPVEDGTLGIKDISGEGVHSLEV